MKSIYERVKSSNLSCNFPDEFKALCLQDEKKNTLFNFLFIIIEGYLKRRQLYEKVFK